MRHSIDASFMTFRLDYTESGFCLPYPLFALIIVFKYNIFLDGSGNLKPGAAFVSSKEVFHQIPFFSSGIFARRKSFLCRMRDLNDALTAQNIYTCPFPHHTFFFYLVDPSSALPCPPWFAPNLRLLLPNSPLRCGLPLPFLNFPLHLV